MLASSSSSSQQPVAAAAAAAPPPVPVARVTTRSVLDSNEEKKAGSRDEEGEGAPGVQNEHVAAIVAAMGHGGVVEADKVSVVVEAYRQVLAYMDSHAMQWLPPHIERVVVLVVVAVVPDVSHVVRVNLDSLMAAMRMAAANTKATFGQTVFDWMDDVPVHCVLKAMHEVESIAAQRTKEREGKMTSEEKRRVFLDMVTRLEASSVVKSHVKDLVKAGLVQELLGLMRDGKALSPAMVDKLQLTAVTLARRSARWFVLRCCC